jgi:hypothetical protein
MATNPALMKREKSREELTRVGGPDLRALSVQVEPRVLSLFV